MPQILTTLGNVASVTTAATKNQQAFQGLQINGYFKLKHLQFYFHFTVIFLATI